MKWVRADKSVLRQPAQGSYTGWKAQIATECGNQCVYCALHEVRFGGMRNFHVEHYRPKSRFANLENDIRNLFLACSICNCFKLDDWPGDYAPGTPSYPDPSEVDYNGIFYTTSTYRVRGRDVAARYLQQRLHLNRHQLILERRRAAVMAELEQVQTLVSEALDLLGDSVEDADLGVEIARFVTSAMGRLLALARARPYVGEDLRERSS